MAGIGAHAGRTTLVQIAPGFHGRIVARTLHRKGID
jgi:hypothetical protein